MDITARHTAIACLLSFAAAPASFALAAYYLLERTLPHQ